MHKAASPFVIKPHSKEQKKEQKKGGINSVKRREEIQYIGKERGGQKNKKNNLKKGLTKGD